MLPLFCGHALFFLNPGAGRRKGIYILNMQCLQISHPCIIIYAMQGAAVKQLIPAACENENLLFHNQISVLLSHLALFVWDNVPL